MPAWRERLCLEFCDALMPTFQILNWLLFIGLGFFLVCACVCVCVVCMHGLLLLLLLVKHTQRHSCQIRGTPYFLYFQQSLFR